MGGIEKPHGQGNNMIKIKEITIVGGGSAGWMTAAHLSTLHPQYKINLIESDKVPTIGVGESTQQKINMWAKSLGLEMDDFIKETDGSYKLSIRFNNFHKINDGGFHYPFGQMTYSIAPHRMTNWMVKKTIDPDTPNSEFAKRYYSQMSLIEKNKINTNVSGVFNDYNFQNDVAVHFDATKFGQWLKNKIAIPKGVNHIVADVVNIESNENGITKLHLSTGEAITSDLYIDCTGFKSILLGSHLKEPFKDFSQKIPVNRAWAVQIPYVDKEKELETFTDCTALGYGWVWNTPLWSRIGTGYVYSDKFIKPEEALEEFKNYLKTKINPIYAPERITDELKFNDVHFKNGKYERLWVKNVVAIGLAGSFIEPLESNGLWSTHEYLRMLSRVIYKKQVNRIDVDGFNNSTEEMYNGLLNFVQLHYALTERDDTEFWKYMSSESEPIHAEYNKSIFSPNGNFEGQSGIACISFGHGVMPFDQSDINIWNKMAPQNTREVTNDFDSKYEEIKKIWDQEANISPSHYKYLKEKFHKYDVEDGSLTE